MIRISIFLFAFSLILNSCGEKKPETLIKKDSVQMSIRKDTTLIVQKIHDTKSGKKFIIIESKPSESISNFLITGTGFNDFTDTLAFPLRNPMHNSLLADLDKDGFEELYLITKSTGEESFLNIFGVASDNDTSLTEIKSIQTSSEEFQKDENMAAYLGKDSIFFDGNNIIREFPLFISSDPDVDNIKGKKRITYSLKPGKEFYSLEIKDIKEIK